MAMLHPSDMQFAKSDPLTDSQIINIFKLHMNVAPMEIRPLDSGKQGLYHKVYFVSLPQDGREVVLRVARKAIAHIKIENEIACINLVRRHGIPAPEVIFFNSDPTNNFGFEYVCLEKLPGTAVASSWLSYSLEGLSRVLDTLADVFVNMFTIALPDGGRFGSLRQDMEGEFHAGPIMEEVMWQIPDIERYFTSSPYNIHPSVANFYTLNPCSSYLTWPEYIDAFLKSYAFIIGVHPNMGHLRHLIPQLSTLSEKIQSGREEWVARLNSVIKPRLWHRDMHFGNMMADENGNITGILDWEFAGTGPSFHKTSSPLKNCLYFAYSTPGAPQEMITLLETWDDKFIKRLRLRSPEIARIWEYESDRKQVLGEEGSALADVREFLRSCIEVGVRGQGNVEAGISQWRDIVEKNLDILGC